MVLYTVIVKFCSLFLSCYNIPENGRHIKMVNEFPSADTNLVGQEVRGQEFGHGASRQFVSDVAHLAADSLHRLLRLFQSASQLIHLFFLCSNQRSNIIQSFIARPGSPARPRAPNIYDKPQDNVCVSYVKRLLWALSAANARRSERSSASLTSISSGTASLSSAEEEDSGPSNPGGRYH